MVTARSEGTAQLGVVDGTSSVTVELVENALLRERGWLGVRPVVFFTGHQWMNYHILGAFDSICSRLLVLGPGGPATTPPC